MSGVEDCYLSNFADMRKRAGRQSKIGGASGYWASEVLTILDELKRRGIDLDMPVDVA